MLIVQWPSRPLARSVTDQAAVLPTVGGVERGSGARCGRTGTGICRSQERVMRRPDKPVGPSLGQLWYNACDNTRGEHAGMPP
jgi:hypothetical protein